MISYKIPRKANFEKLINKKKSHLILLENRRGMKVGVTDYGARIVSIIVPNKEGVGTDVVLGFNSISNYLNATESFHGTTVGRFANRIAKGKFELEGIKYAIAPNNGVNALHGGENGFDKKVWDRRVNEGENRVEFYLVSPDGDAGFPGNLTVSVSYCLTEENELVIKYRAETDAPTVLNLTNHAFFNLNGEGGENISNHEIKINADSFLPVDESQIPTGEIKAVENTDFDFRSLRLLSDVLESNDSQIVHAKGVDHNFVLNEESKGEPAAQAFSKKTGIHLKVYTSEPGLQLYTGNSLNGKDKGKSGKIYHQYDGFCFETQKFPDSPNQPDFPSCVLKPGEVFKSETRLRFSVRK